MIFENGRPGSGTCNLTPDHNFIGLIQNSKHRIFSIAAPLCRQGHSLNEISAMTGIPCTTLNSELKKNKVQLRTNRSVSFRSHFEMTLKCYLDLTFDLIKNCVDSNFCQVHEPKCWKILVF